MTNQDKILFLRRYRTNELEIKRLEEEIERWRSQAERVTPVTGGMGGASGDDKLQLAVDRITDLKDALSSQLGERVALRLQIEDAISSIADERLQQLLRYRYICGCKWENIAVVMQYDYRWVRRLHGRAITELTLESPLKSVI